MSAKMTGRESRQLLNGLVRDFLEQALEAAEMYGTLLLYVALLIAVPVLIGWGVILLVARYLV